MSLFEEFQEMRKILCLCPCCGEIVRVSDLKLKVKGTSVNTWLDDYEKKSRLLDKKEENFEKKEAKLREIAVKKGRDAAEAIFNMSISPEIKKLRLNPHDVEAILHPVDYVAFKGMTAKGEVDDISFLVHPYKNQNLKLLGEQVKKSIIQKKYEWEVVRIADDGKLVLEK